MKKSILNHKLTLLYIFMMLFSLSCSTENDPQPTEDYKAFLDKGVISFSGVIEGKAVAWDSGPYGFQVGNEIGPAEGDEGESQKYVGFSLDSQQNDRGVYIATPGYVENSDDLLTKVLSIGEKKLGIYNPEIGKDAFTLSLTINGKTYYSDIPQTDNHLEVLQLVTFKNEFDENIVKVWFIANAKLYNREDNSFIELKNGKILASFRY